MDKKQPSTSSHWVFDGRIYEPEPEVVLNNGLIGFVYEIEHLPTGRKYIGQKLMKHRKKYPPLKGKKRNRWKWKETDWRSYTSSCRELNELLAKAPNVSGYNGFCYRILKFCSSKALMNYHETRLQFERGVLFDKNYFNGMINCRISRNQVLNNGKS